MWKGLGWVVRINPGYLKGALCCGPGPHGCGLGSEFEEECRGRGLQTLSLSNLGERAQPSLQPRVLGIPQPWVWRGLGRNWGSMIMATVIRELFTTQKFFLYLHLKDILFLLGEMVSSPITHKA